jgi:hypothetical protein
MTTIQNLDAKIGTLGPYIRTCRDELIPWSTHWCTADPGVKAAAGIMELSVLLSELALISRIAQEPRTDVGNPGRLLLQFLNALQKAEGYASTRVIRVRPGTDPEARKVLINARDRFFAAWNVMYRQFPWKE